jgi:predicted dehydrogenase
VQLLRIGTLGTSRICTTALLEPAADLGEVTIAAVAARSKPRADAFALHHGIPAAYGCYEDMLAAPDIDAVYNPLPNSLHGPWTLKAIAAGKHVLCEKPFASNAEQAAQIAEAAEAAGVVVMEAMHYRYHPLVQRLRDLVLGGELGPVRHIQCWTNFVIEDPADIRYDFDLAGGALMDGGCYAIDCLRLLTGDGEPEVTGALSEPGGDAAGGDAAGAVADRAMAVRLAFGDGATGWFESSFTRDGEFLANVHVTCRDGQVWLRNFIRAHEGLLVATKQGTVIIDEQASGNITTYGWQLRAFAAAITGGAPFSTSASHAVGTMRVIDDAYRAAGLRIRG